MSGRSTLSVHCRRYAPIATAVVACGCNPVRSPPVTDHSIKGRIVTIAGGAKNRGWPIARDLAARSAQAIALQAGLTTAGATDHYPWLWSGCSRSVATANRSGRSNAYHRSRCSLDITITTAFNTVPFGRTGSVTNYSRDWRATKYGLRFDRDARAEFIRRQRRKSAMSRRRERWRSVVE